MPANPSYPDTGGVELTDGILGLDELHRSRLAGQGHYEDLFVHDRSRLRPGDQGNPQPLAPGQAVGNFPAQSGHCAVSDGQREFHRGGDGEEAVILAMATLSYWYTLTDLNGVNGRYVRVQVSQDGMRAGPFIDEIEVRQ